MENLLLRELPGPRWSILTKAATRNLTRNSASAPGRAPARGEKASLHPRTGASPGTPIPGTGLAPQRAPPPFAARCTSRAALSSFSRTADGRLAAGRPAGRSIFSTGSRRVVVELTSAPHAGTPLLNPAVKTNRLTTRSCRAAPGAPMPIVSKSSLELQLVGAIARGPSLRSDGAKPIARKPACGTYELKATIRRPPSMMDPLR